MQSLVNDLQAQRLKGYTSLRDSCFRIEQALGQSSPEEILTLAEEMTRLRDDLEKLDEQYLAQVNSGAITVQDETHQQCLALMRETREQVRQTIPAIRTFLATYSAELNTIKKGRTGLGGYASSQDRRGRLINSSN